MVNFTMATLLVNLMNLLKANTCGGNGLTVSCPLGHVDVQRTGVLDCGCDGQLLRRGVLRRGVEGKKRKKKKKKKEEV